MPTDISYAYSGYAPLSLRLVQCAAQKAAVKSSQPDAKAQSKGGKIDAYSGFTDALKFIKGDIVRDEFDGAPPREDSPDKRTLVFFVGGVTYAEIAAIRLMSAQLKGVSIRTR